MVLEIRHLRVVEAIRREGTVTRAARFLHLTQPAVSHALIELEQRLGVELFRRDRKQMVPTPEGERLLRSSTIVLDELSRVERELEQYREGYRGVVRISTQCYTCYNWLPPLLKQFRLRHPDVTLEIVPEAKEDPVAALLDHRLDLAILFEDPGIKGLTAQRLFGDELVAIFPPGHAWTARPFVRAEDFEGEHLISQSPRDDSLFRAQVLAPAGVEPSQWSVIPLTEAVIQTVASGLGVSVLPKWLVGPELQAGRLEWAPVSEHGVQRTWYAAVRDEGMGTRAITDLVADLKQDGYGLACSCRGAPEPGGR